MKMERWKRENNRQWRNTKLKCKGNNEKEKTQETWMIKR